MHTMCFSVANLINHNLNSPPPPPPKKKIIFTADAKGQQRFLKSTILIYIVKKSLVRLEIIFDLIDDRRHLRWNTTVVDIIIILFCWKEQKLSFISSYLQKAKAASLFSGEDNFQIIGDPQIFNWACLISSTCTQIKTQNKNSN